MASSGVDGRGIATQILQARQPPAASWAPASRPMTHMDRFFVAMETWITAYVDVAKGVPNAPDPQAALEAAGGLTAWQGMFEAAADLAPYRPASVAPCSGAPISP